MSRKISVIAILIALVLASFPMSGVFAKDDDAKALESKWDQLVDRYGDQFFLHGKIHKTFENWLSTHKNASASDKAAIQNHLDVCNSALASAGALVKAHPGFDSSGNVIDRAAARTTLMRLANYLQQHAGSVKSMN